MILVFARIEHDFYGNALHHFHVIAGGIFRRQQTEACAAGSGDAVDVSFIFAAIGVDFDGHALPGRIFCELRFFEVRGDPYVVDGTTDSSVCPGWTFIPTSTSFFTTPVTGAVTLQYCKFNSA